MSEFEYNKWEASIKCPCCGVSNFYIIAGTAARCNCCHVEWNLPPKNKPLDNPEICAILLTLLNKTFMNKTLNLTPVTNVADIKPNTEYVAERDGVRYFGKFIDSSVALFANDVSFVWHGSIFPSGIPFRCLDAVYATA